MPLYRAIPPPVMKYDPVTGNEGVYPCYPVVYRKFHGLVVWHYNPFTGDKRSDSEIGKDVTGLLLQP